MGIIIIPAHYEQLPESRRRQIVPIYIEANDRYGNLIYPPWFELGVVPIHLELIALAKRLLGDKWMASDIVQAAVHKLWYQHGTNIGEKPHCRVWRRALWEGRYMAAGGWPERKGRIVSRTIDQIDRLIPPERLKENDWAAAQERKMLLDSIRKTMQQQGAKDMLRIHELLLNGHKWDEIGAKIGVGADALKHRFHRHAKRTFRATA